MKKLTLLICLVTIALVTMAPVVEQASANALPPSGCTVAADLGWRDWGANLYCEFQLEYVNCCDLSLLKTRPACRISS